LARGDSSKLMYREGGKFFEVLFGAAFLAAATFLVGFFLFKVVPGLIQNPPTGRGWIGVPLAILVILGPAAMFGTFGVLTVFGRNGTILDKATGTVTLWSTLLWRKSEETHSLAEYSNVQVARTGGSFRSGPSYSVSLGGESSALCVGTVNASRRRAERLATEVAEFLGVPALGITD